MRTRSIKVNTLIIGSGPVGSTFARKLVRPGTTTYMVDAGPQMSKKYGEHLKNSFLYQRNVDLFSAVISGSLCTASVPTRDDPVVTLDPSAFNFDRVRYPGFVLNGQNPNQVAATNLGAAASTYAVGGMATHWTCAIPRFHNEIELNWTDGDQTHKNPIPMKEWPGLYKEARALLGRPDDDDDVFDRSIRHQVVRAALHKAGFDQVRSLPLAVNRRPDKDNLVTWSAADTVLGPLADPKRPANDGGEFVLLPEHHCSELVFTSSDQTEVKHAVVWNLTDWNEKLVVEADNYIVAGNAILTPQLLHESGLGERRLPALGRYVTEQPMAFCQVVLHQRLMDDLELYVDGDNVERVQKQRKDDFDPVPIPKGELEPNLALLVGDDQPWHCQIHRDAFSYGAVPPNIDTRLIVDLRWFGIARPRQQNRIAFSDSIRDTFGMPQLSFHFELGDADRVNAERMMRHMLRAASALGGFLPGSEPRFMTPGLPLHLAGSTRMGASPTASVVDADSKVWGVSNLYLGGNGLHPFGNASNPTLTSMAMAIRSAKSILAKGARAKK